MNKSIQTLNPWGGGELDNRRWKSPRFWLFLGIFAVLAVALL